MQIQSQLASDNASTNILKKPAHILTFIKHALEAAVQNTKTSKPEGYSTRTGLRMEDLRIVDDENNDGDSAAGDSDDEENALNDDVESDDMTTTAVNLLLSVLEGRYTVLYLTICL